MEKIISQKEMFVKSLDTFFWSWGSDTPTEVFWGANELLDWYEKEFNLSLGIRFERDEETFDTNYNAVIEAIRKS
jgi:hypothetical protein